MAKYESAFKLQVVKSFLAGDGGAKLLARRWSVPEEKIRTWVSHFRLHGMDGLQPKRSVYSAQFKMQVLSHQDREQLSSRQVAAIYDIRNPNQVVVWRRSHLRHADPPFEVHFRLGLAAAGQLLRRDGEGEDESFYLDFGDVGMWGLRSATVLVAFLQTCLPMPPRLRNEPCRE